jgi:hypothetical protein
MKSNYSMKIEDKERKRKLQWRPIEEKVRKEKSWFIFNYRSCL